LCQISRILFSSFTVNTAGPQLRALRIVSRRPKRNSSRRGPFWPSAQRYEYNFFALGDEFVQSRVSHYTASHAAAEVFARERRHRNTHPQCLVGCGATVIQVWLETDIDMAGGCHQIGKFGRAVDIDPLWRYIMMGE
jgi:hypothetical protein